MTLLNGVIEIILVCNHPGEGVQQLIYDEIITQRVKYDKQKFPRYGI